MLVNKPLSSSLQQKKQRQNLGLGYERFTDSVLFLLRQVICNSTPVGVSLPMEGFRRSKISWKPQRVREKNALFSSEQKPCRQRRVIMETERDEPARMDRELAGRLIGMLTLPPENPILEVAKVLHHERKKREADLDRNLKKLGQEAQRLSTALYRLEHAHVRTIRRHKEKVQDCDLLKKALSTSWPKEEIVKLLKRQKVA